jgi:hypothetical protein
MVRLAIGRTLHALIQNDGDNSLNYAQGTPVKVGLPVDAVRVLRPTGLASDNQQHLQQTLPVADAGDRLATIGPVSEAAIERNRND